MYNSHLTIQRKQIIFSLSRNYRHLAYDIYYLLKKIYYLSGYFAVAFNLLSLQDKKTEAVR